MVVGARWPTSPSSSSYTCHHGGSAISDTHLEPGGVASACRTHYFLLTALPESKTWITEQFPEEEQNSTTLDLWSTIK